MTSESPAFGSPLFRDAVQERRGVELVDCPAALYPDDTTGPFEVVVRAAEVAGRMECVELTIRGVPATVDGEWPAVTNHVLRRIPVAHLVQIGLQAVAASMEAQPETFVDGTPREAQPGQEEAAADLRERLREGRGGRGRAYPREHYEEVAAVYTDALRNRQGALEAVRAHFTEKLGWEVTRNTAASWVSRCRERYPELLPPATRGRPRRSRPNTTSREA